MMAPQNPPREAIRLFNGYRGYQLVVAACRLKLPDLVAAGVADADALAVETGSHAASLRRVLRGLAAWGFFDEDDAGRYSATAISESFRSDRPGLRNMTLMLSEEGYRPWGELMHTIKTGEPAFQRVFGQTRWEKMAADPADAARFNAAMMEMTERVVRGFLATYDFAGVTTVVDVGGGNGALLAAILSAHPQLDGVLFDLAAGLDGADRAMALRGLAGRVRMIEGSFFESIPGGGDLYLLKSILHDWDDDRAVQILRACRLAMRDDARLVVVERVVPEHITDDDRVLSTVMSDIQMMVVLGGRERTTAEYAALFAEAELTPARTISMDSDFYAIEALPQR